MISKPRRQTNPARSRTIQALVNIDVAKAFRDGRTLTPTDLRSIAKRRGGKHSHITAAIRHHRDHGMAITYNHEANSWSRTLDADDLRARREQKTDWLSFRWMLRDIRSVRGESEANPNDRDLARELERMEDAAIAVGRLAGYDAAEVLLMTKVAS